MHRLSSIILLLGFAISLQAQSPHGDALKIDCGQCHNPNGWTLDYNTVTFDHGTTDFDLEGVHNQIDCKQCHTSLVFSEAPDQCVSCHTDVHNMSVGNDCVRCHLPQSWLVDNIPELHEENGFPLIGTHANLSCVECHGSDTNLRFERIGNDCVNCHLNDYVNTQNPNHAASGYSTSCDNCHNPFGFGWDSESINHDFFPLTLGHDIQDCMQCHSSTNYADADPDCVGCHQDDYNQASSPNHLTLGFSTDCVACHSTNPDWTPANYEEHDAQFFPIYSGNHRGTWNDCTECHNNEQNYTEFSCFACHLEAETTSEHGGVSGYVYQNSECLQCHPNGN